MYSRGLVVGAALLCFARAGAGQGGDPLTRQLRMQQDAFRAASARVHAYDDSVARERLKLDTVYVHPFHMLVQPTLVPMASRAAAIARADLAWTGRVIERVAAREFVIRTDVTGFGGTQLKNTLAAVLDSSRLERWPIAGQAEGSETLALWLRQLATRILERELDTAATGWLHAQAQFDTVPAYAWTNIRLDLVSFPHSAMRACYDGDLGACRKVLGLTPTRDPAREWFDTAGRRAAVERRWHRSNQTPRGADALCLEGSDAACLEVMEASWFQPENMMSPARVSLLQLALQMGGAGAFERLYEPADNPAERISRIANVPVDSVLGVWHARVHDTRIPSDDFTPAVAMMSLAWVGIFGALSLRSSRWR